MAARSETKAQASIAAAKTAHPTSTGELIFLNLDLNDLTTIKSSAQFFLSKEKRLDVLWNNAGVMVPPDDAKTAQVYELQVGTNNVAPFLFTHFLTPILKETAKTAEKNSVRVIWVSSSAATMAPRPAIDLENMDYRVPEGRWTKYGRSKGGNVLHAAEMARRLEGSGVLSLVGLSNSRHRSVVADKLQSLNPGNLKTDLTRTMPGIQKAVFVSWYLREVLHEGLTRCRVWFSMRWSMVLIQNYSPVLIRVSLNRITVDGVCYSLRDKYH